MSAPQHSARSSVASQAHAYQRSPFDPLPAERTSQPCLPFSSFFTASAQVAFTPGARAKTKDDASRGRDCLPAVTRGRRAAQGTPHRAACAQNFPRAAESGLVLCLVLPLSEGTSWGWTSAKTLLLFAAAVVLLAALVAAERRSRSPLVDMKALANRPVAITNVASVFIGFALFASFVGTANYVQAPKATGYGFGSSVLTAGLCLLPSGVLMLLLAPLTARLIRSWGPGRVLALSGSILAAGLIFRILAVDALWEVIVGSGIIGAGTGIGYAALPSSINRYTPAGQLAAANGINTLARSMGSTLASAVGGSLLAAITISLGGVAVPSLTGYRVLFGICAGAALLAAAGGLVLASPLVAEPEAETSGVPEASSVA